jgi:hypothetical protein
MRETRHEETETRSSGKGAFERVSGRYFRAFQGTLSLPIIGGRPVSMAGRLARSHGRQGCDRLSGSLSNKRNNLRPLAEVFVSGVYLSCQRFSKILAFTPPKPKPFDKA